MVRALLLLAPLLLGAMAACVGTDEPPLAEVPARWNTGIAADVETLARQTGAVFAGRVTAKTGQREDEGFPISLFAVTVLSAASGGLQEGGVLTLEQPGGLAADNDGRLVRVTLEGDPPLEPGSTYLFFATRREDGVYTTAPFGRYAIQGGARLEALHPWKALGAARTLDGMTLGEALAEASRAAP